MIEKLGIFYERGSSNGPKKVANNLMAGLDSLGVQVKKNDTSEYNGCLHSWGGMFDLPEETLVGPNCVVIPPEDPRIFSTFKYHVCPSKYVRDLYKKYTETKDCDISVWPVGIDTDAFYDFKKEIKTDCFVYFKNREVSALHETADLIESLGLTYKIIQYGSYKENQLIDLIKECRFCVLLTHTESQGIAYMEILSSNTPCISISGNELFGMPNSSAPYLDKQCGEKVETLTKENLNEFLDKLKSYSPRQYILDNHTLKKSAENYLKLVERSHK